MKKTSLFFIFITIIALIALAINAFADTTTSTVAQTVFQGTISNQTAGIDVVFNRETATENVYVICYDGQIFVEPNRVNDKITINGVTTSRVERIYLAISNAVKFAQSGGPNTFVIGCTNDANNTYTISFD